MISVQEEILEHYRYLKSDTKALITEAQGIRFLTGDPVELAAMLEIERHAEEILKMIEKMEKRMVGDGDDPASR
ncbi:MAG: hypothetical protein J7L63_05035 [Thermoplasmata archaeon]|nr:hypothetical protein [Thermoplasmata archaeon]